MANSANHGRQVLKTSRNHTVTRRTIYLNFHGVGELRGRTLEPGEENVWVSRQTLTNILDALVDHKNVAITFDDGNASDVSIVLPELLRRSLHAKFFIIVNRIQQPGSLTVDAIRELHRCGMTVGLHGFSHIPWRGLDSHAADKEIVQAKTLLDQKIGLQVEEVACPLGSYDRRVLSLLHQCGFKAVYTSDGGWVRSNQWIRARNTIHTHDCADSVAGLLEQSPMHPKEAIRWAKKVVKRLR